MTQKYAAEVVNQIYPGRVRLKVLSIYRQEEKRNQLEKAIMGTGYVESVKGNSLTGSLLIRFNPELVGAARLFKDLQPLVGPIRTKADTQDLPATAKASRPAKAAKPPKASRPPPYGAPRTIEQALPRFEWHAQSATEAMAMLNSGEQGLSRAGAISRLAAYGPNLLDECRRRSALKMAAEQFMSVPVAMLGISAAVSVATGGIADAVVIGGVVLINAVIGFLTERSAEKTINALGNLLPTQATVLREGRRVEIPLAEVVPGDLLVLTPGTYVPADARLVYTKSLTVDEAPLTGESLPVQKNAETVCLAEIPLGERVNMVHMGTVVTGGSGMAVVTATARQTEIGAIQALVGAVQTPDTPMQRQLDRMGVQLAAFSAGICCLVFGIGVLRGMGWLQMLNSSISLAVAAVPEGLPAVATTTLALGIREMSRRKVLIRQLPAVESLGSVQVLCLDKTGTLTMNQMKVVSIRTDHHHFELRDGQYWQEGGGPCSIEEHPEIIRLLEVVTLCSEVTINDRTSAKELEGSPTECALVEAGHHAGIQGTYLRGSYPLVAIHHRAENRPYMLSVHRLADGTHYLAVKGSPVEVLALCSEWQCGEERIKLTRKIRQSILDINESMASDALRVLGVAFGHSDSPDVEIPRGLVWLGLIGMEDIIRPGMPELMAQFHEAGIETVMITGDQSATAHSVGKRLGLNHRKNLEILDSLSLDQLDPELLANIVTDTTIFARVSPAHKLRIVQALQKSGRVIAMTGDGINDGPALKAADVGVAMGKHGADVARSVADVVLEDDNLHTMVTAVEQGRTIYSNIRKSLRFLLSTNLSEIEVMLFTTALGFGEALNPMQLLWINLVTDVFPALALAMEPPELDVLKKPPRDPAQAIIGRGDAYRLLRESGLITAGTMGVFAYSVARYGPGPLTSTNTFMTLTLAQFLQSISCRSEDTTILNRNRPGNHYLNLAIAGSIGLQALTVFVPPLRGLLRLAPMGPGDLAMILAGTVAPFLINEASKNLRIPTRDTEPEPS
jgi:Ca2+-transporting ATPase